MQSNLSSRLAIGVSLILSLWVGACAQHSSRIMADRPYHHLENGFRNPPNSPKRGADFSVRFPFFLSMMWRSITGARPIVPDDHALSPEQVRAGQQQAGDQYVTWIGHATFLVQLNGIRILTDPIFSKRASPVRFAGPARHVPPALDLSEMTDIDVVVVSHSHYDHLDLDTLAQMPNPQRVTLVVPLGIGQYVRDFGFKKVVELDWYEQTEIAGVIVRAYPAVHWSNRGLFDINETLWMSYAMSGGGHTVYHTGDTETHPTLFAEIGADMQSQFGGCDLGLMSVGAYDPRPMMTGAHMDPEGGVAMGRDLGCRRMIPMHWGTFTLSLEPFLEPAERFAQAAGASSARLRIGETLSLVSSENP